jgi:hypothetical protein
MVIWYLGPLNKVPGLDFIGSHSNGYPQFFIPLLTGVDRLRHLWQGKAIEKLNRIKNSPRLSLRGVFRIQSELADDDYVSSLRALGAFLNGEFNFLTFFKVFETVALDRGEVHENIRAAFTSKKAVALASVEPFDCSCNTF